MTQNRCPLSIVNVTSRICFELQRVGTKLRRVPLCVIDSQYNQNS